MKQESALSKHFAHIAPPGQRIIRSVIAVWVCMLIYALRGLRGEPFYSIIAAVQCIQPYSSNMLTEGRDRIIGTLIGAFWGAFILFMDLLPMGGTWQTYAMQFLLLGVFTGLVIYSTVLFKIPQFALFSAVVFLGIAMFHMEDVNPYIHVINRSLDTIIGVGVAIVVNSVHLPRVKDRTTLFVSGIDYVLFREDRQMSPYTKVELNRCIADGMRFTVSTRQTPATVRETLSEINLRLPIVAMDGAVLYNLETMQYLRTVKMNPDLVRKITDFFHEEGMPFFLNTVQDNLLVIYFRDYKDLILEEVKDAHHERIAQEGEEGFVLNKSAYLALARLYRKKRTSPYRNYVRTNAPITEDVVYLLIIDQEENIDRYHEKLMACPFASQIRVNFETFDCENGEKIMRIYAAAATREAMLSYLQRKVGAPRMVTFGTENNADVIISDARRGTMVRELKKRYEPVSLKGWRNSVHM